MKLFRIFVFYLCFFVLCGCSAKGEITPVIQGISFEANIQYYNEKYLCDAQVDTKGNITLTFKSPENLEGLVLSVVDGKSSIQYMGLTYSPKGGSLPLGNIATLIDGVFNDISDNKIKQNGKNIEFVGKVSNEKYVISFSPSGLPLLLNIGDSSIIVQFNNQKIN